MQTEPAPGEPVPARVLLRRRAARRGGGRRRAGPGLRPVPDRGRRGSHAGIRPARDAGTGGPPGGSRIGPPATGPAVGLPGRDPAARRAARPRGDGHHHERVRALDPAAPVARRRNRVPAVPRRHGHGDAPSGGQPAAGRAYGHRGRPGRVRAGNRPPLPRGPPAARHAPSGHGAAFALRERSTSLPQPHVHVHGRRPLPDRAPRLLRALPIASVQSRVRRRPTDAPGPADRADARPVRRHLSGTQGLRGAHRAARGGHGTVLRRRLDPALGAGRRPGGRASRARRGAVRLPGLGAPTRQPLLGGGEYGAGEHGPLLPRRQHQRRFVLRQPARAMEPPPGGPIGAGPPGDARVPRRRTGRPGRVHARGVGLRAREPGGHGGRGEPRPARGGDGVLRPVTLAWIRSPDRGAPPEGALRAGLPGPVGRLPGEHPPREPGAPRAARVG